MVEGFFAGILSSFFVWWLIQRLFAPRIKFGEFIQINHDDAYESGHRFVVEFWNAGLRKAFDVEVFARLYIEKLRPGSLINRHIVSVKLHRERIPIMRSDGRRNYASLDIHST